MAVVSRDVLTVIARDAWASIREGEDGTAGRRGVPTHGYMVGGASHTLIKSLGTVTYEDVYAYVEANAEMFTDPEFYLGWWTHKGKLYLDVAEHFTEALRDDALAYARFRREIAIWSLHDAEEIKV